MIVSNASQLLLAYLLMNLLVALAYVALAVGRGGRGLNLADAAPLAKAGRALLVAIFTLPLAVLFPQARALGELTPQVFDVLPGLSALGSGGLPLAALGQGPASLGRTINVDSAPWILGAVCLSVFIAFGRVAWAWGRLRGVITRSIPIASSGQVRVRVSPEIQIPFSAWLPGRSWVVLPESCFGQGEAPDAWRIALSHELQHHRQGDTRWLYALALLKGMCIWNPFAHGFVALSRGIWEMRCDHALLERGLSPSRYARALCQVAESALAPAHLHPLVCATLGVGDLNLKERILLMTTHRPALASSKRGLWAALAVLPLMGGVTLLSSSSAQALDDTAASAAFNKATKGGFPVVMNDTVKSVLERMTTEEKWTQHIKGGLERLPGLRPELEPILKGAGLPLELLAVVVVESGAENLSPVGEGSSLAQGLRGAGLWMFIPGTARAYGLQVDADIDERLDIPKETQAAAALLGDLHRRYGDWALALAAYNQGASHVEGAMKAGNTRDPWALMDQGLINNYAARIMATVVIMADPSLLD